MLDCCDNFATRHAVNRACVKLKTPLVSGAGVRFEPWADAEATDGWRLASRGYVPHGVPRQPSLRAMTG